MFSIGLVDWIHEIIKNIYLHQRTRVLMYKIKYDIYEKNLTYFQILKKSVKNV